MFGASEARERRGIETFSERAYVESASVQSYENGKVFFQSVLISSSYENGQVFFQSVDARGSGVWPGAEEGGGRSRARCRERPVRARLTWPGACDRNT